MNLSKVQWSWAAAIPYLLVRLACFGVFWTGLGWANAAWLAGGFLLRMWALTVGYHRYFAHRAFRTSRPFQFLLALAGSTCLQGGVIWWAETHRRHHRNADTPDDLHSPHFQGWFYSHYGWFLDTRHRDTRLGNIPDLARFPELVFLDRWHFVVFGLLATIVGLTAGLGPMLWAVFVPTVMMWEITHWVQSFSHSWGGYRRYESSDQSRNHWLLGIVGLGEFHNNHHRFPGSSRQGHVWWEVDAGYWSLRLLEILGLVWNLNIPHDQRAEQPS